ncbi:MAG: DEAD/DEAH box helicase, partial [Thermaerobacterales bacterium]
VKLPQVIEQLQSDTEFMQSVTEWRTLPARPARYAPFPPDLNRRLVTALQARGIAQLYVHQEKAVSLALNRSHLVVVTPTASGKTLCYNLPVLHAIMEQPSARALYLFPTKALARDQYTELHNLIEAAGVDIKASTYDGDTPVSARRPIRNAGHIVLTNPDMLHTAILPHHTRWMKLFENLRYIVIDELHTYRGVFGSHLANVLRRLERICAFYGSRPTFILSSATIANPTELAAGLTGQNITLVDDHGAPQGPRHFVFYNPPVVNRQLGIRRSALLEARKLAARLLFNDIQTLMFARSRLQVEVLLSYLRTDLRRRTGTHKDTPHMWDEHTDQMVRGYRGGYLPEERRSIEQGLRNGTVRAVVSTNALELGIDIGSLEAAILVGYPGTVASTWQQAGRAGRRSETSLAILVASSGPLDQYVVGHTDWFFDRSAESARIHPDNLYILINHIKCAAFELPFRDQELYGGQTVSEILSYLASEGVLRQVDGRWHWMTDHFPANDISLRSAAQDNFVIIDQTRGTRVIGEVDRFSAPLLLHEEAIYLHESRQFQVERLDHSEKKAFVRAVDADYYTDANLAVEIKVLDVIKGWSQAAEEPSRSARPSFRSASNQLLERTFGEILVTAKATIFKKIKLHTHENVGWGKINLPEEQMHTTAYWLTFNPAVIDHFHLDRIQSGLLGLGHVMGQVAPVYLMCDPRDLHAVAQVRSPFTDRPTIYLYDAYPGGIGLAERLFDLHDQLIRSAYDVIQACPCADGCPSCIGPGGDQGGGGAKNAALGLLHEGLARNLGQAQPS